MRGAKLKIAAWLLETFGPLVTFYAVEHTFGLKAAIVASIAIGVVLVVKQIVRDRAVSPFTVFVAASVLVFGVLDLRLTSPFFLKLEPALGNLATATFFLGSVVVGRPVIVELASKQAGTEAARAKLERARGYMTRVTVVWGLFFVLRAAAYVWMAFHMTLDQTLVVRGIAGPLSFALMIGGEMAIRYLRFGKRAFGGGGGDDEAVTSAARTG